MGGWSLRGRPPFPFRSRHIMASLHKIHHRIVLPDTPLPAMTPRFQRSLPPDMRNETRTALPRAARMNPAHGADENDEPRSHPGGIAPALGASAR